MRWHRRLGVVLALVLAIVAITGVLLNHTDRFALSKRYVASDWLLDWYGVRVPGEPVSFKVGEHFISQLGTRLYYDAAAIEGEYGPLLGAVLIAQTVVIGVEGQLLVLTPDGALIEKLGGQHGVPAGMRGLGRKDAWLVIRAAHGDYLVDAFFSRWHEQPYVRAAWSQPTPLPPAQKASLVRSYRAHGLSLEKVVGDLHSGRILGPAGPYILDFAALLLLVLTGTGVWMWTRRPAPPKPGPDKAARD